MKAGKDPMLAPSGSMWGHNTNFGSCGQFALAKAHQVLPKAPHLTWEEAAAPTLVGTTAYRMVFGCGGNTVQAGQAVLIWGGFGSLRAQAIQLVRHAGAIPVVVVSDSERSEYCKRAPTAMRMSPAWQLFSLSPF